MEVTSAINKTLEDATVEIKENISAMEAEILEKIDDSQRTLLLWMLGILVPMWVSLMIAIIALN
jgi:transcriptional regulator